jgi:hypothetical protein
MVHFVAYHAKILKVYTKRGWNVGEYFRYFANNEKHKGAYQHILHVSLKCT